MAEIAHQQLGPEARLCDGSEDGLLVGPREEVLRDVAEHPRQRKHFLRDVTAFVMLASTSMTTSGHCCTECLLPGSAVHDQSKSMRHST